METKEIQEAEIISEKENIKLEMLDPVVEIKSIGEITSNIEEVKNTALKMQEHYKNFIVTNDNLNDAKDDKANINKIKDKVADYRKSIVAEFNKPIENFEKLAKETEKILKETYEIVNNQCNAFDEKTKGIARDELRRYFEEYKQSKNIAFIQYSDMNQSVGLSDISDKGVIAKKKYTEINEYIDSIENDVNTIESMDNSNEILTEYMKDRNLARSIKEVQDRHYVMNCLKEAEESSKQKEVIEEKVETKAEILQAPTTQSKKLKRARFEIIYEDDQIAKDLVNFMKERGINYAVIK